MRRALAVVGLFVLGGCALLVDLSGLSGDAGPDSSAADGGPCADGGVPVVESVTPSNADTIIGPSSPTLNFGASTVANVSFGIPSAGLLRFTFSATAAAALNAARGVDVAITLARVINDPECGGTCPAAAGTLTINPLTPNWTEGNGAAGSGATWLTSNGSTPWAQAGALGIANDIAAADTSMAFDGMASQLTFTLPASAFAGFVGSNQLAVRVGPSNGAVFVVATHENALYSKPVLKVTYCR